MELTRKSIRMCRLKKKAVSQITMDDDFIVPDVKPDIEKIILDDGNVEIEEVKKLAEKAELRGRLSYKILYHPTEGNGLCAMEGTIPFDEYVNIPELEEKDYLQVEAEVEDLTIELIHSRKINVKAILTFCLNLEGIDEQPAVTAVEDDGPVETLMRVMRAAQTAVCQKDTYRLKEEIEIAGTQPDIEELLWSQCRLRNVQIKPLEGQLGIQGTVHVFCIYRGPEAHIPPQWLEKEIPFSGTVELPDATEDMYPEITSRLGHCQIEIQPDFDGENRSFSLDVVMEMDIKLYQEETLQVVSDVYSPAKGLEPEYLPAQVEEILVKNSSKTRLSERLKSGTEDNILQICHVDGVLRVDDKKPVEGGLMLEGALCLKVLYMTDSDSHPLQSMKGVVPFQYKAEARGMDETCAYQLDTGLEQLSATMLGGGEIEVKASVIFDLLVRKQLEEQIITGITEAPLDLEWIQKLPGIVVYVVQPGDTLWKIAKKFHASVDSLRQCNELGDDNLMPGKRLLVMKQVEEAV
ncbi:MAG: DUF3794 domain-containing protein [Lachnospiraceae bacterium]|jgi:hypothetical protein|nr:DUF3794 domain-containing protein [Lachnospiraceae bacterium]